jgi:hypothetical protein
MNTSEATHELLRRLREEKRITKAALTNEFPRVHMWVEDGFNNRNLPGVNDDPKWEKIAKEAWSTGRLMAEGIAPHALPVDHHQDLPKPENVQLFDTQEFIRPTKRVRR